MESKEWLESLKKGDKIAESSNYHGFNIYVVDRVTTTQIITEQGIRFKRDTGKAIGRDIWNGGYIVPVTKKILDELKQRSLRRKCKDIEFNLLSIDAMERIFAIANEVENGK